MFIGNVGFVVMKVVYFIKNVVEIFNKNKFVLWDIMKKV